MQALQAYEQAVNVAASAGNLKRPTTAAAGAGIVNRDLCEGCNKTVYAVERMNIDEHTFHKSCFRCTHCNNVMKIGNFAFNAGRYYCKPHFKQLFAIKGNYSGGFQNDNKSPSSFNPSGYGMPDGAGSGASPVGLGRKPSLIRDRVNAFEPKQAGAGESPVSVNGSTQHLADSTGVSPGSAVRDRAARFGSIPDDHIAKDTLVTSLRQQLEERDAQIALLKQENDALRAKLQGLNNSAEQLREAVETPNASSALVAQVDVEQSESQ